MEPSKQEETMGIPPAYPGYVNQGYTQAPGYSQTPGYTQAPGYSQTPGYPQQPAYHPQPAYPPQYGQPQQQQQSTVIVTNTAQAAPVVIEDNLVKAILVTLFCFWPTGIAAIIQADSANTKARLGDAAGASLANQDARKYIKISIIVGGIVIALSVILIIVFISLNVGRTYSYYG